MENTNNYPFEESRIIMTTHIPRGSYSLGKGYTLRPVKYLGLVNEDDEDDVFKLSRFARAVALSEIDHDSLNVYKDLVVFHTFVTDKMVGKDNSLKFSSITYHFAETSNTILVDNSKLEFITEDDEEDSLIDFEDFPVETSINEDRESMITRINYGRSFWKFVDLKASPDSRSIYNRIQLWAYASNYVSLHRLYCNEYFPMSLYVAILDSMLPKSEECGEVIAYCHSCGRKQIKHPKRTWRQSFLKNYGRQFDELLSIRSSTFHAVNYMDYMEEWDKIGSMVGNEAIEKARKLDEKMFALDEIEELVKIELIKQFMGTCV